MSEDRDALVDDEAEAGPEAPYDAGDRRAVRKREVVARRRDSSERMVLRQIMGSSEGRAWMYRTLEKCHVYQTSFSRNALDMAYSEGERNIGLQMTSDVVRACPERYMEMLKEAKEANDGG